MADPHPLDRPVWNALATRQGGAALGGERALRFNPDYGLFAAAARPSPACKTSLGELVAAHGPVALVEAEIWPEIPGTEVVSRAVIVQMSASELSPERSPPNEPFEIVPLTDLDAREMHALATLTEPGPFFVSTHRLGDFFGVKHDGRLVAMAGERMRPVGFTEVSGVCTHPEHRGKGYGEALSRHVAAQILARGETPFLHAYAHNEGAIDLYRRLGFTLRRRMHMTVLRKSTRER